MSTFIGTEIVNSGLVFHYDSNNLLKSWKGAPATNLFTETNLLNWSTNAPITLNSYNTPFGSPSYTIVDNNSSGYLNISRNTTVPNDSSSYTISVLVKKTYGATSARLGFNIGFDTGGTTVATNPRFNSDTGVGTGASVDLGDWWYWYFTITNNGTGNTNLYCNFFPATGLHNSADNSAANGVAVIGDLMLVAGSTAARFISGTRSNTQALLDLTGRNVIAANSLTYASNNMFSFDGTNNFLTAGPDTNIISGNQISVEAWVRTNVNGVYKKIFTNGSAVGVYLSLGPAPNNIYFGVVTSGTSAFTGSATSLSTTAYSHLVGTYNGSTISLYLNGTLVSSAAASGTMSTGATTYISGYPSGGERWDGRIDAVRVYNRGLTATEVRQNFEATRSRYGI